MGEASGEGAIYPGGGARESLNGLCGEVEMTVHGKPQVMRAHPHRSEGRTEGGNEGVEGGGIVGGRGREATCSRVSSAAVCASVRVSFRSATESATCA